MPFAVRFAFFPTLHDTLQLFFTAPFADVLARSLSNLLGWGGVGWVGCLPLLIYYGLVFFTFLAPTFFSRLSFHTFFPLFFPPFFPLFFSSHFFFPLTFCSLFLFPFFPLFLFLSLSVSLFLLIILLILCRRCDRRAGATSIRDVIAFPLLKAEVPSSTAAAEKEATPEP